MHSLYSSSEILIRPQSFLSLIIWQRLGSLKAILTSTLPLGERGCHEYRPCSCHWPSMGVAPAHIRWPPKNTISEKRIALYISQLSEVVFCFFFILFDKLHMMKINFPTSFSTLVRKWIVIGNWHFPAHLYSYKDY